MDRQFSADSPYSTTATERFDTPTTRLPTGVGYAGDRPGYRDLPPYEDYPEYPEDSYDDYDPVRDDAYADYDPEFVDDDPPLDRRWVWTAGVAGAVLLVAVVCTVMILGGGDSGSVSATMVAPPKTSQPATTAPPAVAAPAPSLPPERMTTVTPTPSAAPSPTADAAPPPAPVEAAPPPPPAASPRTVTYRVTGNRQLLDLVTIIYTDQRGALQTDVNVALPWSKTVVLDPGVELKSVTATSVAGQLSCAITDAGGATLVSQAANTMIATCTQ